jgi:hypothetical protein
MLDASPEIGTDPASFETLDRALEGEGPGAMLDALIEHLTETGAYRALLDALLLKTRFELGLPLVAPNSLSDVAEPVRSQYEERYVDAIRKVGAKFLESGDIPAAWPYYRAIGEFEPISKAIAAYVPAEGDERLGAVIEVAFNQGANPKKGYELILNHYGTCSAISAFEQLPRDEATRAACADRLVRQLHEHLVANVRAEISYRGETPQPEASTLAELLSGRDWLFAEDAYHIDVSHLAATVRVAPLLVDPATIALALDLTEYGRRLSERHRYPGEPPFENTYEDHAFYLGAVLGRNVEEAIAHFRAKFTPPDPEVSDNPYVAQALVGLLVRLGRLDEAVDVAAEHLAGVPESMLACPSLAQLCQRAGKLSRLAAISRDRGDLVDYAAAILQRPAPGERP